MRRTLAVSLLALVCSTGVYAQAVVGSGAVTGLVKDMYGDGIPDCTIVISNKGEGVKRVVNTSDVGIFDAPGLIPADSYGMKVTRRGYADWELPSFDLSIGETLNFTITLYADKASTPVTALRALSSVQDSKTSVSALVTDTQFSLLPSDGRLFDKLVLLSPAVNESPEGALIFRGEPYTNAFLLDGRDASNTYFLSRPDIAPFFMQESASEMQVVPAAAPAEFGHTMGGMINMVSKTGTNGLHLSAYDFFNQNAWNSPDFFGNGFKPTGHNNQAGISAGVPIAPDSLFLFGNMERIDNSSQGLNRIANPLITDPTGATAVTTGCTATAAQCSAAQGFINQQLNVKVPMADVSTSGFARMDFRPGARESFTVSGSILTKRAINGLNNATVSPDDGLLGDNADTTYSTRYTTFGWAHVVNGIAMNQFHGDWFRDTFTATTNPNQYPPSTGPVAITLAGTPIGGNPATPFNLREQRYGGTDTFTLTENSHTIKVGADISRNQDSMQQLYAQYGQFNYNSFSAFAADYSANVKQIKNFTTFNQTLGTALSNTYDFAYHVFAQDTWKLMPGLVLTAGIRWEKDRLTQPSQPNPNNFNTGFIPSPNTDFAPRLGIAYLLDKRTVVRIGGGSYYQPFVGQLVRDLYTQGGIFQTPITLANTAVGVPAFPKPLPSTATTTLAATEFSEFYTADRYRNPYTIEGTAAIERRMNRFVSLALTAIQSQGVKLWTATDQTQVGSSTVNETYSIVTAAGAASSSYSTPVWNPAFAAHRYQADTEGASKYRAATAQVRSAPIFGLSVQASYTWSHSIDDVSGPPSVSIISSNVFPGNYTGDRGNSSFDQRNRAVVNWTWQPVFNKSNDVLSRYVINGWMISGVGTYASSMFATPMVDVIGQQFTGVTMEYTSSLNGTDGWSRAPFLGVGSVPIGSRTDIDVRLSRALPLGPRLKGRLMFEAFNVTNHQNNSEVNTIAYTAVAGILKPVTGFGAPIASYGYPFGTSARHVQVSFRLDF